MEVGRQVAREDARELKHLGIELEDQIERVEAHGRAVSLQQEDRHGHAAPRLCGEILRDKEEGVRPGGEVGGKTRVGRNLGGRHVGRELRDPRGVEPVEGSVTEIFRRGRPFARHAADDGRINQGEPTEARGPVRIGNDLRDPGGIKCTVTPGPRGVAKIGDGVDGLVPLTIASSGH